MDNGPNLRLLEASPACVAAWSVMQMSVTSAFFPVADSSCTRNSCLGQAIVLGEATALILSTIS
jgi:hypothetical protein